MSDAIFLYVYETRFDNEKCQNVGRCKCDEQNTKMRKGIASRKVRGRGAGPRFIERRDPCCLMTIERELQLVLLLFEVMRAFLLHLRGAYTVEGGHPGYQPPHSLDELHLTSCRMFPQSIILDEGRKNNIQVN